MRTLAEQLEKHGLVKMFKLQTEHGQALRQVLIRSGALRPATAKDPNKPTPTFTKATLLLDEMGKKAAKHSASVK